MAEGPNSQALFYFKSILLLKDQSLGIGSYGAVCKAKCDNLLCAAKIIHPTLFDPTALPYDHVLPQREHRLPIVRFEQECEFMSAIRHPNIVQYLGSFRDTDTHLPVLLMELMDDSLTHFLDSSTKPIPYCIQVNICHDITLALSFLHSNNIVHRDLSSNNVLLIGNIRAKVTDFGMARLGDTYRQTSSITNTVCPGTDVYMPPEAVQDKPVYTEKIDCFSFGVITVQILTQQFPKPGDRLQEVEFSHPGLPPGKILVQVPEINRRRNHISQVSPDNPLLPVALDCMKDKDSERPSAHQLCKRVADLKGMPKYLDSAKSVRGKDEVIESLMTCVKEKDLIIASKEEENQELRQQLQQERDRTCKQFEERERQPQQENNQALRENRTQLQKREHAHVIQHSKPYEKVVAQFDRRIVELGQKREQRNPKASSKGKEPISSKLRWREGKRAPFRMSRWCDAVADGNTVYIRGGGSVMTYCYNVTSDRWSKLPDCVYDNGSITIIKGWLTNVGGYSYSHYSNELFSLTGKGSSRKWTKKFPPMPTKRMCTIAVYIETTIVVAGGWGEGGVLSTVEVMSTENHQWSTTADLPQPVYCASATVCEDQLYVLGGRNKEYTDTKSVYTCSVSVLLQACRTPEAKFEKTSEDEARVWKQVADIHFKQSTCESFHGKLLAIGGLDARKCTTAINMYNLTTNSWETISHMKVGRYDCFAAVLPNNQLMVVGGFTDSFSTTDTVEVGM